MDELPHDLAGACPQPIAAIAEELGLSPRADIEPYGRYVAKLSWEAVRRAWQRPRGRLIYITAMTATPAGEGKTTVAIGLTQALGRLGHRVAVCLREPSLGPVFGVKGGATGGGRARVEPSVEINLHFTGDLHAVAAAHNLLAAMVDNHLHYRLDPPLDPKRVVWRRVLDINDRALRRVIVGLGGPGDGVVRETGFDITAASEVMAVLCLSRDTEDLKARLGRLVVGEGPSAAPGHRLRPLVTAQDVRAVGAMAVLLKDALKPNLVQTVEGQPAFVHGGPFANIAHGNNSVLATRTALGLCDYVVTEGGFGAELGAEKFLHIVVPQADVAPDAAVVVATVRALHHHGGAPPDRLHEPDLQALQQGFANLDHHVGLMRRFGLPVVVAVNRFARDDPDELRAVVAHCRQELGVPAAVVDVVARGGDGGLELAREVLAALPPQRPGIRPVYRREEDLVTKLERLAVEVYGAEGVQLSEVARRQVDELGQRGLASLPVCVAKTQLSLSDQPGLRGAPRGWRLRVSQLRLAAGAGFVVALTGDVLTMPGLPREPAAWHMDLDAQGSVVGLS